MTITELQERVTGLHFYWNQTHPVQEEHVVLKLVEEVGEMMEQYLLTKNMYSPTYRKTDGVDPKDIEKEFAKELADVLYNVALVAGRTGVDLDVAMQERFAQLQNRAIADVEERKKGTAETPLEELEKIA
ncbi:MAG: hypothetical protein KC925_03100 [Candidatus Doudnabacteria bacterium]|nr:hypothetical protein [Candidatus Doudnabacteria bacterium]MCA9387732.1 hypothetical protein [Candidatus Andersenbacteria bacterium]